MSEEMKRKRKIVRTANLLKRMKEGSRQYFDQKKRLEKLLRDEIL